MLICGSSHVQLAQEICAATDFALVRLDSCAKSCPQSIRSLLRGKHAFVLQTGKAADGHSINLFVMELLELLRAAKDGGAARITAVVPCFPYARQDKQEERVLEPITAKLVAKMIERAGASDVIAVELHSAQIQGFFDIPANVLSIDAQIAQCIREQVLDTARSFVIVSPDVGGVSRATAIGELLHLPIAVIYKERHGANRVSKMLLVGDVAGRVAIVVDDMVDTCGTLALAARTLINSGAVAVHAIAAHGILSGDAQQTIANAPIESVIVANTVPIVDGSGKVKCFSIAPLLAEAMIQSL